VFERGELAQSALLQGIELLGSLDLRSGLDALTQPSLWLANRRDGLVPPAAMRAASTLNPRAQFRCFEGAGHAPLISHVEETVAVVRGFLERQRA
jgi:pimeloyl-[acyl-carrier protein] methyl ester esterase